MEKKKLCEHLPQHYLHSNPILKTPLGFLKWNHLEHLLIIGEKANEQTKIKLQMKYSTDTLKKKHIYTQKIERFPMALLSYAQIAVWWTPDCTELSCQGLNQNWDAMASSCFNLARSLSQGFFQILQILLTLHDLSTSCNPGHTRGSSGRRSGSMLTRCPAEKLWWHSTHLQGPVARVHPAWGN